VEYTFKNSLAEKAVSITLNQYNFSIQHADKEEVIPYAGITSVRLSRTTGSTFRILINAEGREPVIVSNKYFLPNGSAEDRSKQYVAFVRVLHYHLKEKSTTSYISGFSLNLLTVWLLISAFASFFVSFVSEYLEISLFNPFVQALILTGLIVTTVIIFNRGHFPKHYSPGEIPLRFLP
jgi:hypothetical protein